MDEYDWRFEANTWTHVAVTYAKPWVNLYKNGRLTQTGHVETSGVTGTLYVGGMEKHWGRFWYGLMDEVAVFNRTLTAEEIEQLYSMTGRKK